SSKSNFSLTRFIANLANDSFSLILNDQIYIIVFAILRVSNGSTNQPVSSSTTFSGIPPTLKATQGTPNACASNKALQKPSFKLVCTYTSHSFKIFRVASCEV